jgi:hypothetical protein
MTSGLLSVLRGLLRLLGRGAGADSVDEHLAGLLALLEADLDQCAVKRIGCSSPGAISGTVEPNFILAATPPDT